MKYIYNEFSSAHHHEDSTLYYQYINRLTEELSKNLESGYSKSNRVFLIDNGKDSAYLRYLDKNIGTLILSKEHKILDVQWGDRCENWFKGDPTKIVDRYLGVKILPPKEIKRKEHFVHNVKVLNNLDLYSKDYVIQILHITPMLYNNYISGKDYPPNKVINEWARLYGLAPKDLFSKEPVKVPIETLIVILDSMSVKERSTWCQQRIAKDIQRQATKLNMTPQAYIDAIVSDVTIKDKHMTPALIVWNIIMLNANVNLRSIYIKGRGFYIYNSNTPDIVDNLLGINNES